MQGAVPATPSRWVRNPPPQGSRGIPQRRAGCSEVLKYLVAIYLKSSQLVGTIYIIKNTWRLVLLAKIYISV